MTSRRKLLSDKDLIAFLLNLSNQKQSSNIEKEVIEFIKNHVPSSNHIFFTREFLISSVKKRNYQALSFSKKMYSELDKLVNQSNKQPDRILSRFNILNIKTDSDNQYEHIFFTGNIHNSRYAFYFKSFGRIPEPEIDIIIKLFTILVSFYTGTNQRYPTGLHEETSSNSTIFSPENIANKKKSCDTAKSSSDDIIENIQDWVIETTPFGVITFSNRRSKDFIEYNKDEILGTSMLEYIHENYTESILKDIKTKVHSDTRLEFIRLPLITKTGLLIYTDASIIPLFDESGTIKGIRCIYRNVTDKIKGEEISSHYRLLADYSNIFIFFIEEESGKIMEVNEAAVKFYGYTRTEFLNMKIFEVRDKNHLADIDEQYKKAGISNITFRTYHSKKDGTSFPVEVASQPTHYKGKKLIISLVKDISENILKEMDIERMNRSLHLISECNKILIVAVSEDEIYDNIIKKLEKFSGYKAGWIASVNNRSELELKSSFGLTDEKILFSKIDLNDEQNDHCIAIKSIKEQKTFISHDFKSDSLLCRRIDHLKNTNISGAISIPIKNNEFLYGSLTLYSTDSIKYSDDEVKLLDELCANLGFGINSLRKRDELIIIEQNARKSEKLLRNVLDSLPVGIIFTDKTGNLLYQNPEAINIWGAKKLVAYNEIEIYTERFYSDGKKIEKDNHPLSRAITEKISSFDQTYQIITFDDKNKTIQSSAVPFFNSNNELMGCLLLFRDVTSEKTIEAALKSSEMEYRALIEGIADIVLRLDKELKITFYNKNFEILFGWSKDKIHDTAFQKFIDPKYHQSLDEYFSIIRDKKTISPFEVEFISKDGSLIPFELSIGILRDSDHNFFGYHCVARNINERKKLENQLLQSQKMEAIGRLAGGIAHDFNNILTIIFGYSDFLMMKVENNAELRNDVEQIISAGKRASTLTQQLLAFSRREIIELKSVNLNEVILELKKMLNRLIGEDIKINFNLNPDLKRIKADTGQIDQIILNLVVNARDAMPNGGTISISTNNFLPGKPENINANVNFESVRLIVADDGFGIKPEHLNSIFDPFFTTKPKGKGTGLGLSVVYGIVKQYGGEIAVESQPGIGTNFIIDIPVFEDNESLVKAVSEMDTLSGKGETILLIEDDQEISNLISEALKLNNYKVINADTLKKALELFGANHENINLVFSDVVLPDGNGVDLIQMLQAILPDLKVILASGYADEKSKWSIIQKHKYNFLSKPFDIKTLFRKIRIVLDE